MSKAVEYRVRPVTRYIVTRFESERHDDGRVSACSNDCRQLGPEYANEETAFEVAYALCKQEHERLGYPLADERVQYPLRSWEAAGVSVVSNAAL